MTDASAVLGSGVARNSIWSLVGSLGPAVAVTIASIVMARRLGPDAFGQYVFAVFVYGAAAQLAIWGLPNALVRYLAVARASGDDEQQEAVVRVALYAAAAGAVVVAAAVAAAALVFSSGQQRVHLLMAAAVVLVSAPTQLFVSMLTGRELFRELAVWQLAVGFANPALTVLVVLLGSGVTVVLVVDVVLTAGALAVLIRLARPLTLRHSGRGAPSGFWSFAMSSAVIIVLGVVIFQRSEILFLERYGEPAAVALYGIAFGLSQLAVRITTPLLIAITPALARVARPGAEATEGRPVARALHVSLLLGGLTSGIGWALAPAAVQLLYGPVYAGAAAPARLLFLGSWAMAASAVPGGVAQGRGRLRPLVVLFALGGAVNLALDVALIPSGGPGGAAVANTVTQTLVALLLLVWLVRTVPSLSLGLVLRTSIAAVAGALGALPFLGLAPLLAIPLGGSSGAASFFVVARLTGVLDDEMLQLARHVADGVRGVLVRRSRGVRGPT